MQYSKVRLQAEQGSRQTWPSFRLRAGVCWALAVQQRLGIYTALLPPAPLPGASAMAAAAGAATCSGEAEGAAVSHRIAGALCGAGALGAYGRVV